MLFRKKKITLSLSFIFAHLPATSRQLDRTQHWEERKSTVCCTSTITHFPACWGHFLSECSYNSSSFRATAALVSVCCSYGVLDDIFGRLKTSDSDDPSTFLKSSQLEDLHADKGDKLWEKTFSWSFFFCMHQHTFFY